MLITNAHFRLWVSDAVPRLDPMVPPEYRDMAVLGTNRESPVADVRDGDRILIRQLEWNVYGTIARESDFLVAELEGRKIRVFASGTVEDALEAIEAIWQHGSSPHQQRVARFMKLAGQRVREGIREEPAEEERILAATLLYEEVMETIDALGVEISPPGKVFADGTPVRIKGSFRLGDVLDGVADVSVVNTRILSVIGAPDLPLLELVDANNLAKFGPGHTIRSDGKLVKPPGHQPPDLGDYVRRYSANDVHD